MALLKGESVFLSLNRGFPLGEARHLVPRLGQFLLRVLQLGGQSTELGVSSLFGPFLLLDGISFLGQTFDLALQSFCVFYLCESTLPKLIDLALRLCDSSVNHALLLMIDSDVREESGWTQVLNSRARCLVTVLSSACDNVALLCGDP